MDTAGQIHGRIPLSPPHPFVQDGERARIAVNRHAERLRHAVGGDVTVGRSDPAGGDARALRRLNGLIDGAGPRLSRSTCSGRPRHRPLSTAP